MAKKAIHKITNIVKEIAICEGDGCEEEFERYAHTRNRAVLCPKCRKKARKEYEQEYRQQRTALEVEKKEIHRPQKVSRNKKVTCQMITDPSGDYRVPFTLWKEEIRAGLKFQNFAPGTVFQIGNRKEIVTQANELRRIT